MNVGLAVIYTPESGTPMILSRLRNRTMLRSALKTAVAQAEHKSKSPDLLTALAAREQARVLRSILDSFDPIDSPEPALTM